MNIKMESTKNKHSVLSVSLKTILSDGAYSLWINVMVMFKKNFKNGKHCILYRHHLAHYGFILGTTLFKNIRHIHWFSVSGWKLLCDHSNVQVYEPNTGKHASVSEAQKGMSSALYGKSCCIGLQAQEAFVQLGLNS